MGYCVIQILVQFKFLFILFKTAPLAQCPGCPSLDTGRHELQAKQYLWAKLVWLERPTGCFQGLV